MTDKEKEEKAELEEKIDHLEVTVDELRGALNHHRRLLSNLARAVRIVNEVYLYAEKVDKQETELDKLIAKRRESQTMNSEVSHD